MKNFRFERWCLVALLIMFVFSLVTTTGCSKSSSSAVVNPPDPIIDPDDPVYEPQWVEPENIGISGSRATNAPTIAVGPTGLFSAFWSQNGQIWTKFFFDGRLEDQQQISTGDPGVANVRAATDSNNNSIAVWQQAQGTNSVIWAARFTFSDATWHLPQVISEASQDSYNPQIVIDGSQNALVVWEQFSSVTNNFVIMAKRFNATSQTWGASIRICNNAGNAQAPQIAFDANGNAMAVWFEQVVFGGNYDVSANYYSAVSNEWSGAVKIENNADEYGYYPSVQFDRFGNAVAVWHQFDGVRSNIWAARFEGSTLTWQNPRLIENFDAGNANYAQIAFDYDGNAHVVWQQSNGVSLGIATAFYDAQTDLWQEAQVIDQGPSYSFLPKIVMYNEEDAVVIWQRYDEDLGGNEIWSAYYNAPSKTWFPARFVDSGQNHFIAANCGRPGFNDVALVVAIWIDSTAATAEESVRISFFE